MYERRKECFAHLRQYVRGQQTILEETSDKRELFELKAWSVITRRFLMWKNKKVPVQPTVYKL
jgi:hypothetical protein